MKKILNSPQDFVRETVEGICLAYPGQLKMLNNDFRMLVNAETIRKKDKVGIVTAGGSGHLPVFLGYVGQGLLDGCAIGDVFASPSATKMSDIIRACDFGKGVLCLYGNYGGDKMNFAMATEEVEFDGIKIASVLISDDIASSEEFEKRRGVAGMVYAFKIAGAAADLGYNLEEVASITKIALENIRTMGVALSPCIVPTVGEPTFTVADGKMEIGMGIHGEAGIEIADIMKADELASLMFNKIDSELQLKEGDKISVLVNGLGATPQEELFILYREIVGLCKLKNITCVLPHIGEYATSMEMAGCSITIFKLNDELYRLLEVPAVSPFYTNNNIY